LIQRTVEKVSGAKVNAFDFERKTMRLECESKDLKPIMGALSAKGYYTLPLDESLASEHESWNFLEILRLIGNGDRRLVFERNVLLASFLVLLASLSATLILYNFFIPPNLKPLLPLMMLGSVGIALSTASLVHVRAFGKQACNTGMMVGMGVGMVIGFFVGALLGASNGMFVGSLVGILVGMGLGAWAGYCCGNMGVLEGIMAGFMSGTMGSMISVMLYNDRQFEFLAIIWIVGAVLLAGLSYMLFKENGPYAKNPSFSLWKLLVLSIIATVLLDAIILFGPKSAFALGA